MVVDPFVDLLPSEACFSDSGLAHPLFDFNAMHSIELSHDSDLLLSFVEPQSFTCLLELLLDHCRSLRGVKNGVFE